ncbi:MAG: class I SAM-dependent methyltransferase [Acidobacteriota bacterium]
MSSRSSEQIYSSYSHVYDFFFDAILEPGRRRAIEALRLRPGDTVLEIGVGTGLSLPHYPDGCRIIGIDISSTMLAQARSKIAKLGRTDVTLRRMSAEALEYPDASFDKVLLSHVISCVENPRRVIEEVHRVSGPGARVVFLNHFVSGHRLMARAEHHLTPLTRRIGFALDTPLDIIRQGGLFHIERVERVNIFGLCSMVRCVRRDDRKTTSRLIR